MGKQVFSPMSMQSSPGPEPGRGRPGLCRTKGVGKTRVSAAVAWTWLVELRRPAAWAQGSLTWARLGGGGVGVRSGARRSLHAVPAVSEWPGGGALVPTGGRGSVMAGMGFCVRLAHVEKCWNMLKLSRVLLCVWPEVAFPGSPSAQLPHRTESRLSSGAQGPCCYSGLLLRDAGVDPTGSRGKPSSANGPWPE